ALKGAQAVLFLATPDSLSSEWVSGEWSMALSSMIPVIPILGGGARFGDLPAELANVNGIDLAEGFEESINKLVVELAPDSAAGRQSSPTSSMPLVVGAYEPDDLNVLSAISAGVGVRHLTVGRTTESTRSALAGICQAEVLIVHLGPAGNVICDFIVGYAAG